ncbi:MAG TPA: glycosyltransferase [Longimicrobiaceae bacterium]|nr:glycosyltransferase [Longimicrobiaceae bacterium]
MKQLPVAIVLPCLDEESTLLETCRSLGFPADGVGQDSDIHLIIVDNGSTDRTLEIAEFIAAHSAPGSVHVVQESERGYVPPRHTGTQRAGDLVEAAGWSDILIVQADADTTYTEGYVQKMRAAAAAARSNALLEGTAEFPAGFGAEFLNYISLCAQVDECVLSRLGVPPSSDLICTDTVCAYRLSDYVAWGGHLREYTRKGDEIHAETTRLYLRSLTLGSHKVIVRDALAYPSARKVVRRPGEEFATAGFPREASWREAWRARHPDRVGLEDLPLAGLHGAELEHATHVRERHLVALFGVLPLHVFRVLGRDPAPGCDARLRTVAAELPARDMESLYRRPGVFIEDVLALVDAPRFPLFD